jgi:hypothetical protein
MARSLRWLFRIALATLVVGGEACTSPAQVESAATSVTPAVSQMPHNAAAVPFTWPRQVPVIATIRAPEPPADSVRLYAPILLAAYREVCADVTSVQSAFRPAGPRSKLILVRCGARVHGVRLIFTGVVVPNMRTVIRNGGMQPENALAVLGLRGHITLRPVSASGPALINQEPAPGQIVPFGTVVFVVIAG